MKYEKPELISMNARSAAGQNCSTGTGYEGPCEAGTNAFGCLPGEAASVNCDTGNVPADCIGGSGV
jgi:SynChlorMet cassette protein ScmA